MKKPSFYTIKGYLFRKLYHWSLDLSNARNWYTNKWTLEIQLINLFSNWLDQPLEQVAYTFDYVYRFRIFVTCVCAQSIVTGFHIRAITLLLQNWSRLVLNRKRLIQLIQVIVRILLLPWIQWVMIQAIESYETNSVFSVEISWITRITDPSVQAKRSLISIMWVLR